MRGILEIGVSEGCGVRSCRWERRGAEIGAAGSPELQNGPKRHPNLNCLFKLLYVLIGNPVDPATGGDTESKVITAMDRLPGSDPGGDVAVLGAERRRRVSDALGEAYSPGTREVYRSHWARWTEWAGGLGVRTLPAAPVHVAAFLTDRAEEGCRPATLRAALAAIAFAHRAEGLDSPTEDEGVGATMKGLSRMLGRAQRQAPGLTRDCLAAIRAVACLPRRGRGGRLETPEYARRRGLVDIALASVMRDGLLRRGEAAAATWADVTWEPDGSGRLLVRRSKTDPEGIGTVLYLSRQTAEDLRAIRPEDSTGDDPVFGLSAQQIHHRLRAAARAAGLGGEFSGHSARVGMAQDLAGSGVELPALMTAGRWSSPTMPARYTRSQLAGRGAVARYYGE